MVRGVRPVGSGKGLSLALSGTSRICFRFHLSSDDTTLFCFSFTFIFTSGPKQLGKVVMSPSWLSMLLPGPLSGQRANLFWPLFSNSSSFQSEPLTLSLTPILTSVSSTLRLSDHLPGLCPRHYRSNSMGPGLLSFVTLLHPTPAFVAFASS